MGENRQISAVILKGPGVDLAYYEALSLAKRARACIARGVGDCNLSQKEQLIYSIETMRLSSRIMNVMAWGMFHKAYEAGEIDRQELRSQRCRLGDEDIFLTPATDNHKHLPYWFHDLMEQSVQLYRRALRLQRLLDQ